jgi:hypothetical protein
MNLDEAVERAIQRAIELREEAERVKELRPNEGERGERLSEPDESTSPEPRPEH